MSFIICDGKIFGAFPDDLQVRNMCLEYYDRVSGRRNFHLIFQFFQVYFFQFFQHTLVFNVVWNPEPSILSGPWCLSWARWMTSACSPFGISSCGSLSSWFCITIMTVKVRSSKTPLYLCNTGLHSPLPMSSTSYCMTGSFSVSLPSIFLVRAGGSRSSDRLLMYILLSSTLVSLCLGDVSALSHRGSYRPAPISSQTGTSDAKLSDFVVIWSKFGPFWIKWSEFTP